MTFTALPITSAGRFWPFGPVGILLQLRVLADKHSTNSEECIMPITISYDLAAAESNDRNYIRSMFERFSWKRLGGSVFRYNWVDDNGQEDWLNDVVPALMMFRSYCLAKNIKIA